MLSDRQTFAGKNWAFSLCSSVFVRSTHGRDILLDPNRLKSQTFFSGLKTPRNKSSTTSPNGVTSSFNKSAWLAASPRCVRFLYRDQTNYLMLMMRGVLSVLFIVALAVLPTQLKGSPKCVVRVSSKNELDLFIKQQIRKKNNSNLLISFNSCMKELCVSKKS